MDEPRSFRKLWNLQPALQTPGSGDALTFPANPVVLSWSGVPGAAHYLVSVASDPTLGSLVFHYSNQDDPKGAAERRRDAPRRSPRRWRRAPTTGASRRSTPRATAASPTPVASFNWLWPSTTAAQLEDLNAAPEAYDPRFSWNPIPGAARYEVEINSSVGLRAGLQGLLRRHDDRDVDLADQGAEGQRLLLAGPRARSRRQRGRLELRRRRSPRPSTRSRRPGRSPGRASRTCACATTSPTRAPTSTPGTAGYQTRGAGRALGSSSGRGELRGRDRRLGTGTTCGWATADYLKKTSVPEWTPLDRAGGQSGDWQGTLATGRLPKSRPAAPTASAFARAADRDDRQPRRSGATTRTCRTAAPTRHAPVGPAFTWTAYPTRPPARTPPPCASGYPCLGDYLEPVVGHAPACARRFHLEAAAPARTATSSSSRRTRTSAT